MVLFGGVYGRFFGGGGFIDCKWKGNLEEVEYYFFKKLKILVFFEMEVEGVRGSWVYWFIVIIIYFGGDRVFGFF